MIFADGMRLAVFGLVPDILGSYLAARGMSALLFGGPTLLLLPGAVVLVLLIVCANVAGLLSRGCRRASARSPSVSRSARGAKGLCTPPARSRIAVAGTSRA
jgi:hypothetical protein